jgi:hypothetical protein
MDGHQIYCKSAAGTLALATRDAALSAPLRSLLIMVDGRRRVDDLCRLAGPASDTRQLLSQLDDMGMIEAARPPGAA